MLMAQLLNEATRYNVLDRRISDLVTKQKAANEEESKETFSKDEAHELKVLRDIKKNDIWETSGSKVPAYGPSLSVRLSSHRELVLFKRADGKIAVVQCSETDNSSDDKTLAVYSNTEVGYNKAIDYFMTRATK